MDRQAYCHVPVHRQDGFLPYGDNWLIMLTPMEQESISHLQNTPGVADFGFLGGEGEGIIEDIGGIDALNERLDRSY